MTLEEMKSQLAAHGVARETLYSHGGFGSAPEVLGFECIEGVWYSYTTERGSKQYYRQWDSEEALAAYVYEVTERTARSLRIWSD